MAGFSPVGSSPVASIGSSSGGGASYTIDVGTAQFSGFPLTTAYVFPGMRVNWIANEIFYTGGSDVRLNWIAVEVFYQIPVSTGDDDVMVSIIW